MFSKLKGNQPTNAVTRRLIDRGVPSSAAVQEDDALVGDVLEQLREVSTQAVQQDVLVLGVRQVELKALSLLTKSLEEVREPVAVPGASQRLLQALQASRLLSRLQQEARRSAGTPKSSRL